MNMKNIRRTQDIVEEILEKIPGTRNDDDLLYEKVCESVNEECLKLPLRTFLQNRKKWKVPPFESVRRSRQKLQASRPWLRADETVECFREMNEEIVRKYARETL